MPVRSPHTAGNCEAAQHLSPSMSQSSSTLNERLHLGPQTLGSAGYCGQIHENLLKNSHPLSEGRDRFEDDLAHGINSDVDHVDKGRMILNGPSSDNCASTKHNHFSRNNRFQSMICAESNDVFNAAECFPSHCTVDVRPGQFRSRTPGPGMMSHDGSRSDMRRPKTPTAHDMRMNTPDVSGRSYNSQEAIASMGYPDGPNAYGSFGTDCRSCDWSDSVTQQDGHTRFVESAPRCSQSGSRHLFQDHSCPYQSGISSATSMHMSKCIASAKPSTVGQYVVPDNREGSFQDILHENVHSVPMYDGSKQFLDGLDHGFENSFEFTVQLQRQKSGYGFRIVGGTEEGSQVSHNYVLCYSICTKSCP